MDWGTVPGWLAAGSLILAFVIFLRDRRNAERSQVDLVGAWGEGTHELIAPGEAEVIQATINLHLRNASELPVTVKQLAHEVHTRWFHEVQEHSVVRVYDLVDAAEPLRAFVNDLQLAPGETKELGPYGFNLAHLAPDGSNQLAWPNGVTVRVAWLLLIDNAGRRWVVKPQKGRRARRVLRWWRPEEYMPAKW
jgi:hypothetical protein